MNFDPRLTPARPDLAAAHLKGQIDAQHYADGQNYTVSAPVLDMTGTPHRDAALTNQLLQGEIFTAYETDNETGLAWGQAEHDGYVGYVSLAGLDDAALPTDAQVVALSTHLYPAPNFKTRPLEKLPFLARLKLVGKENGFYEVDGGGFCPIPHIDSLTPLGTDFVRFAERFLDTPYLWGGRSSDGIDCSALVQIALAASGRSVLRDTDMQEKHLGQLTNQPAERGDLVFWKGHVGIMQSPETLLHANAHFMKVTSEPLETAKSRIAKTDGPITARKRLISP